MAGGVAVAGGLWGAGRSAQNIYEHATHGGSLTDLEMIPEWCGVIGGVLGAGEFAGALKGAQVARLAKAGNFAAAEAAQLGKGATLIFAAMGKTAKLANYVGLAAQAAVLAKNWKDMPPGERATAVLQLLAFAGQAAAHEALGGTPTNRSRQSRLRPYRRACHPPSCRAPGS